MKYIALVFSPLSKFILHSANTNGPSTTFEVLFSALGSVVTIPQKDTSLGASLYQYDEDLPGEILAETKMS